MIIGSMMVASTKSFKFMSTAVFQIEEICVQGNRSFLVLRMQLNNKDRRDYRFNDISLQLILTTVFQANRRNQHSNK